MFKTICLSLILSASLTKVSLLFYKETVLPNKIGLCNIDKLFVLVYEGGVFTPEEWKEVNIVKPSCLRNKNTFTTVVNMSDLECKMFKYELHGYAEAFFTVTNSNLERYVVDIKDVESLTKEIKSIENKELLPKHVHDPNIGKPKINRLLRSSINSIKSLFSSKRSLNKDSIFPHIYFEVDINNANFVMKQEKSGLNIYFKQTKASSQKPVIKPQINVLPQEPTESFFGVNTSIIADPQQENVIPEKFRINVSNIKLDSEDADQSLLSVLKDLINV